MRLIIILFIVSVLYGCGDDRTSIPQPQPVPSPLRSMIRLSSPEEDQPLMSIIGLPGAVVGAGKVIARNPATDAVRTGVASAKGSFLVVVVDNSTIELTFENEKGTSEPLTLGKMQVLGDTPALAQTRWINGSVVSSPDDQGMVTVANGELIDATPDSELLVSNATTGDVVVDRTDANGDFSVKIGASTGDDIYIMLVSNETPDKTSDFLTFKVP